MKPLLNTLYVTTQGAYVARDGETVAVRVEHETRIQVPVHTLASVVCFGQVSCSPAAMALCAEHGVGISFLTEHGRFVARVQGPVSGNVLLRKAQYRFSECAEKTSAIAGAVVYAKVANCRGVLLRAAREQTASPGTEELSMAARRLGHLLETLSRGDLPVATVRGHEGDAARTYFGVFDHLIGANKDAFFFRGRSRRPPLDNMNALLSFLYTLLTHDTAAALETVGLDPAVGYLHEDRPGRPSLALDLVEELRPMLADRLALSMVNRRQLQGKDFAPAENGAVLLAADARKQVLAEYQRRKQEEIVHPYLGESVAIGMLPHVQATLLARHLRGDMEGYASFLWK
jgi:CRISPR-associated protein Cas1